MNEQLIEKPIEKLIKNKKSNSNTLSPVHYYNHLIKIGSYEHFINNPYMNDDQIKKQFIKLACEYNRLNFVKYLINDLNDLTSNKSIYDKIFKKPTQKHGNKLITYECLSISTKHTDISLFKYLIDNTDFNPDDIGLHSYYHKEGNNLLCVASFNKNINLVRYMVDVMKLSLNKSSHHTKPFIIACTVPDNIDVVKYLVKKSIEQNIVYDLSDQYILKNNSEYNIYLKDLFKN
jgi:hypothetical protein